MVKKVWEREAEKKAKAAQGNLPALPQQHWAPNHGLSPVQAGHENCNVPQLPQFGAAAVQPGRHLALVRPGQGQVPAVAEKKPGDSAIVAGKAVSAWSWRNRWQLTPVAASALAMSAATAEPVLALAALTAVGGGSVLMPDEVRGRKWLSRRERKIAAAWASGGFVWTLGTLPGFWTFDLHGAAIFGALTAVQTGFWCLSRRVRSNKQKEKNVENELSENARQLLASWAHTIGSWQGPKELQNSHIVPNSMREPNQGTIAFTLELRDTVHAQDAVSDELRKTLERKMRLGVGSVKLAANKTDSGQVRVTILHDPDALKINAEWPGPVLEDQPDGSTIAPFSLTPDGEDIPVLLNDKDGVMMGFISGTTGVGKSNSLTTWVLPGIMARRTVMIYVDGGQGTSASHLAGGADWWAVEGVEAWQAGIYAAFLILKSRKVRRSAMGLSRWDAPNEVDPDVKLVIDEATTVARALGKTGTRGPDGKFITYADMVLEVEREGRKLGVSVIQLAQDALGTDTVGGRQARDLAMSGGTCIGHRPTGATSNMLTGTSSAESVDLRALPSEAGWCGVIQRGHVVAKQARVRYAEPEKVEEMLATAEIRGLEGADAEAAAPAGYASRVRGRDAADRMRTIRNGGTVAEVISIHKNQPGELDAIGATSSPAATDHASTPNAYGSVAAGVSNNTCEFCGQPATSHGRIPMCTMCAAIAAAVERALPPGSQGQQHTDPEGWRSFLHGVIGRPAGHAGSRADDELETVGGITAARAAEIAAEFPELAPLTGAARTGQEAGALNRFRVLEILREEPEGIKFGGILDRVDFPKGTLSRALKRLATDGDAHKSADGNWHAGPEVAA